MEGSTLGNPVYVVAGVECSGETTVIIVTLVTRDRAFASPAPIRTCDPLMLKIHECNLFLLPVNFALSAAA